MLTPPHHSSSKDGHRTERDGPFIAGAGAAEGHKNGDGGVNAFLAEHCIIYMLVRQGH